MIDQAVKLLCNLNLGTVYKYMRSRAMGGLSHMLSICITLEVILAHWSLYLCSL